MQEVYLLKYGILDELAIKYGTDKSSKRHDYMRFYEFYFLHFQKEKFNFLELGVGPEKNKGKSLKTWHDYFPNAQIIGVDKRPDAKTVEEERISIEIGDLGSIDFLNYISKKYPYNKIILDDASHRWSHQVLSFEILFPTVEPGGLYIIEDIHTSFFPACEKDYADSYQDAFTYFNNLNYIVCGRGAKHTQYKNISLSAMQMALGKQIDAISLYHETFLIIKKPFVDRKEKVVEADEKNSSA